MNRFQLHHHDSIQFAYSCFDRIILNGAVQQFMHTKKAGTMRWFLRTYRNAEPLHRRFFAGLSRAYHQQVEQFAREAGVTIATPPKDVRREDWVEAFYQRFAQPGIVSGAASGSTAAAANAGVAVILRAREAEQIAVHYAMIDNLAIVRRYVDLYYFYLQDPCFGRMYLRVCPYFPFNVQVWINGHHWLECRLREEGIACERRGNLFVACANPHRLQELSDSFGPEDILRCVEPWIERLAPVFTLAERDLGFRHRFYMTQMEYCHNLIFHKRAMADRLFDRLMDVNRGLGHPDKLAVVFGRPTAKIDTRTGQTVMKITKLRTPVMTSRFKATSIKQYISNGLGLRTESTCHQLKDIGVKKNIVNMPKLRDVLNTSNQRYLDVQQDVLVSTIDRGQLKELSQPSVSPTGRRVPGLRLDDPRLMAVLQAITCFAYLAAKGTFRTKNVITDVCKALDQPDYTLSQLRYDLSKLRGKGLLVRPAGTHSYALTPEGYKIAILYLKLYQRVYAPLTAVIREPIAADNQVLTNRRTKLDRLYVSVDQALDRLAHHVGMST